MTLQTSGLCQFLSHFLLSHSSDLGLFLLAAYFLITRNLPAAQHAPNGSTPGHTVKFLAQCSPGDEQHLLGSVCQAMQFLPSFHAYKKHHLQ